VVFVAVIMSCMSFGWLHSFFRPVIAARTMADLPVAIVLAAFSERKWR
jgi:hypothetical protein